MWAASNSSSWLQFALRRGNDLRWGIEPADRGAGKKVAAAGTLAQRVHEDVAAGVAREDEHFSISEEGAEAQLEVFGWRGRTRAM